MKKLVMALVPLLLIAFVFFFGSSFFCVVDIDEQGVLLRWGKVVSTLKPGFHWKSPVTDSLVTYPTYILQYDSDPVDTVTRDKKNLVLDSVALFRITDPKIFYSRFRTMEATQRGLSDVIDGAVKLVASSTMMEELMTTKREQTLAHILEISREQAKDYGISIENVAFKRVTLPKQNEASVYESMSTERKRVATQLRSEGKAAREEIVSKADRERTKRISEALRKAEEIKGNGDREAQKIIADATAGLGNDLYMYLRKLELYRESAVKPLNLFMGM